MKMINLMVILGLAGFSVQHAHGNDDRLHVAAHVGTSYAINAISYLACREWNIIKPWDGDYSPEVRCSDPADTACAPAQATNHVPCMMLSAFGTFMIGFLYKHLETPQDSTRGWTRAMLGNAGGIVLSTGTFTIFRWK